MVRYPLAGKAGKLLARHFQETNFCHGNSIIHGMEEYHYGWQERSRRLYRMAAEVRAAARQRGLRAQPSRPEGVSRRPERALDDSPGQRPGNQAISISQALKGRDRVNDILGIVAPFQGSLRPAPSPLHGIHPTNELAEIAPAQGKGNGLFVKKWDFDDENGGGHGGDWPYRNIHDSPYIVNNAYVWIWDEVGRTTGGLQGQNQDDPKSDFMAHWVVKIGNTYYDPSYGETHESLAAFDGDSVSGYFYKGFLVVDEADYGGDANDNGIQNEEDVQILFWCIRPNPEGTDVEVDEEQSGDW